MAHHDHNHGKGHHPEHHASNSGIHRKWWFWVAVILMLVAMFGYVATVDEAIGPGGEVSEEVPADAE